MASSVRLRSATGSRGLQPALDGVALAAFAVIGVASHDGGLPVGALARVGVPLLVAWFAAARVFGVYRSPGARTLLTAWVVSVPAAVLVRTLIAGGPWDAGLVVFLGVAMGFTLLFLLAARVLARAVRPGGRVVD